MILFAVPVILKIISKKPKLNSSDFDSLTSIKYKCVANLIDLLGRLLISALFLISAYNKIFSIDGTMSWMEEYGIPSFYYIQP